MLSRIARAIHRFRALSLARDLRYRRPDGMKTSSLIVLLAAVTACGHKTAPHPVIDAGPSTPHDVHRIVYADHRHVVNLRVGDKLALPDDAAFDWRVDFEDKSSFTALADAGAATEYQSNRAGLYRMMVFGMPKCLAQEAGCGLSKRRWDVTANVQ